MMTKTWSQSPQHMLSLDLQIWSVTSARNGFCELWNTPTQGKSGKSSSDAGLTQHLSPIFCSLGEKSRVKFCYYGHLLQLLKHPSLAGKKRKRQTENVRFALVTCIYIPHLSMICKCPHVPPCPETFPEKHFAISLCKRRICVWADSYKNTLPGNPDASKLHLYIQNITNGNRRFPTADNRKAMKANNHVSKSVLFSQKAIAVSQRVLRKDSKYYIW